MLDTTDPLVVVGAVLLLDGIPALFPDLREEVRTVLVTDCFTTLVTKFSEMFWSLLSLESVTTLLP
jgi:hypothetical protein